MRRYFLTAIACFFAVSIGIGTALAGGSSDTSGDGFHCYLFFSLGSGEFAQAMVNDSDPNEVIYKVDEFIDKYVDSEGGELVLDVGNINGAVCAPNDSLFVGTDGGD